MKIKALIPIVIIGFVVAFTYHFIAIAAIDAPHNEASNEVGCGDCHGQGLLFSPFWGYDYTPAHIDDTPNNKICFRCHTYSSGDYTGNVAPLAQPHSDRSIKGPGNEAWSRECIDCHNPHYQNLKFYKNTDADNLYLASGEITGCADNGDGTSTLTYSTITYKTETGWDAAKLMEKTIENRRAILFPDLRRLGYSYEIKEVNDPPTSTIIVFGEECDSLYFPSNYAVVYGQFMKQDIMGKICSTTTDQKCNDKSDCPDGEECILKVAVKFFDKIGQDSFAFDETETGTDPTPDGVCQVCHTIEANPTNPTHWRADGTGANHYNNNTYEEGCIHCHSHVSGFGHGSGGTGCEQCHGYEESCPQGCSGTTISHSTHTENNDDDVKGPLMVCGDCHDTNNYPIFNDGKDLSETNVCDTCHSPGGDFDGLVSQGDSVGAKTNWTGGIYQDNDPFDTLTPEYEKWCAGCHDDAPSVVNGETAPDICSSYSSVYSYTAPGYYLGAHGNETYGVIRQEVSDAGYSRGACVHCHATTNISAISSHGGQLFAAMNPTSQTNNFCFKCHCDPSSSEQTGMVNNNDYGGTFGGGNANSTNIKDAFNFGLPNQGADTGSSHNLQKIRNGWMNTAGGDWVTTDTNACVVCHDPHYSQKNHSPYPTPPDYKTAIRRPDAPSSGINRPMNLWGDEANSVAGPELLSEPLVGYTYQAPKRVDGNYEPGGGGVDPTDGSNLPGFNRYCSTCHYFSIPNAATDADPNWIGGRALFPIDWSDSGDMHGKRAGSPEEFPGPCTIGSLKSPYDDPDANYVLSCTDCHEPHGSPNVLLLRTTVNGTNISTNIQTWTSEESQGTYDFCSVCHNINENCGPHFMPNGPSEFNCGPCHYHGALAGGGF